MGVSAPKTSNASCHVCFSPSLYKNSEQHQEWFENPRKLLICPPIYQNTSWMWPSSWDLKNRYKMHTCYAMRREAWEGIWTSPSLDSYFFTHYTTSFSPKVESHCLMSVGTKSLHSPVPMSASRRPPPLLSSKFPTELKMGLSVVSCLSRLCPPSYTKSLYRHRHGDVCCVERVCGSKRWNGDTKCSTQRVVGVYVRVCVREWVYKHLSSLALLIP
jgi:hypothetical protein